MDLAKPTQGIEMPKGDSAPAKIVPTGKPAANLGKFGPNPSETAQKHPLVKGSKTDLWAPLKPAAPANVSDSQPAEDEEDGEVGEKGEITDETTEVTEGEETEEHGDVDPEEGDVADEEARTAKAITLKTKDGKKLVVPKDALFPYKKDGKIEWIPFNLAARQIDGLTNYSNKLGELNQERAKIGNENAIFKRKNEMWEGENQKRQQLKETLQGIFTKGTPEDKIKAMDHFLANQVGTSPELYMYEMLDYLGPHAARWAEYSDDKRNYLKAQARINWSEYQTKTAAERSAKEQGETQIAQTAEQAQAAVMQMCETYGFTPEEWEKRYDEVATAKERGEIRDFDLNTVLYHTMYHQINNEVVKNAAREINPIFKDPAKAKELADGLFELFKANPTKPRQWFLDMAREAYGQDAAVRRVNESHRRSTGTDDSSGNGKMVKKKKQEFPPYQRWR